jgi:hypothetical protein
MQHSCLGGPLTSIQKVFFIEIAFVTVNVIIIVNIDDDCYYYYYSHFGSGAGILVA